MNNVDIVRHCSTVCVRDYNLTKVLFDNDNNSNNHDKNIDDCNDTIIQ